MHISRAYRVLNEKTGNAFRATVFINPEGIIASKLIYPQELGRNSYEILRILQGIQYEKQSGLGVPANWVPGQPGIPRRLDYIGRI